MENGIGVTIIDMRIDAGELLFRMMKNGEYGLIWLGESHFHCKIRNRAIQRYKRENPIKYQRVMRELARYKRRQRDNQWPLPSLSQRDLSEKKIEKKQMESGVGVKITDMNFELGLLLFKMTKTGHDGIMWLASSFFYGKTRNRAIQQYKKEHPVKFRRIMRKLVKYKLRKSEEEEEEEGSHLVEEEISEKNTDQSQTESVPGIKVNDMKAEGGKLLFEVQLTGNKESVWLSYSFLYKKTRNSAVQRYKKDNLAKYRSVMREYLKMKLRRHGQLSQGVVYEPIVPIEEAGPSSLQTMTSVSNPDPEPSSSQQMEDVNHREENWKFLFNERHAKRP